MSEPLESRILLTTPVVQSISRTTPPAQYTTNTSVAYTVTFNTTVNGVDVTDFQVLDTVALSHSSPIIVSGSGSTRTVTINGIHGNGTLQLNLIDNDSITSADTATPLAGTGTGNGSFLGQVYSILPTNTPSVVSINRTTPAGPTTTADAVAYTVTFSQPVTGVDPTDFVVPVTGTVTYTLTQVTPVNASVYTVTVSGISGSGTLGLNLVDNASIRDLAGNPLTTSPAAPSFAAQSTVGTSTGPYSVSVADVNGDGKPDLVVADSTGYAVTVHLGNGDGTFQPRVSFSAGYVRGVAVADLNGDGNVDIVGAVYDSNRVSVLLGNGNGTFRPRTTFATGNGPHYLALADINGDGKADLVVSNHKSSSVGILLGNGNGTFQPQATFATGVYPFGVAVADLNSDGKPDVAALNFGGNSVSVLLGNGNGSFQPQATFAVHDPSWELAIADINQDGNPDLVATSTDGVVDLLLGNGNGTFGKAATFPAGLEPFAVTVADLNGDGLADVAVSDSSNNRAGILLGNGNGTFQTNKTFYAGNTPRAIAAADVNGDGRADLLLANWSGVSVSVLLETGPGFAGQTYTIARRLDTINGTADSDQIKLVQDADHTHIDWTLGTTVGQMDINDPAGLTINGISSSFYDTITLDYTSGNPLPNAIHFNGIFIVKGLTGATPLANTLLEIGQSTVQFNYSGSSLAAVTEAALSAGYNAGAWNGEAGANGAITSASAAGGPAGVFGVGWADSADGTGLGLPFNTVEVRYTVMGDANLDRVVNSTDALIMTRDYLIAGKTGWDQGNFNYDTTIDFADALILQKNFARFASGSIVASTADAVNSGESGTTVTSTPPGGDSSSEVGGSDSTDFDPTRQTDKKHRPRKKTNEPR